MEKLIDEEIKKHSWNDYFGNIRKKYNMRVSQKNPLVIDLDGKNVICSFIYSDFEPKNFDQ